MISTVFMAKKALAVSIVIPVYNEERHLKACLNAIAAQTVAPAEVIVVDNNSTDRSAKIAGDFKLVKVLHEKRQGIVWARNKGFDVAKSPIIGRIDADTRLPNDWVERIQEFYNQPAHANTALTGGCTFYNVRLPRLDQWITSQFVFRMNRMLVGHYLLWGSNMTLPRDAWWQVKKGCCVRTDIHEDLDLSIHLHRQGFPIFYQATLVVGARMGRVFEDRQRLWPYLKMWPRTLRAHNFKNWPGSYVGAWFLWVMQIAPRGFERIAVTFGRSPLN